MFQTPSMRDAGGVARQEAAQEPHGEGEEPQQDHGCSYKRQAGGSQQDAVDGSFAEQAFRQHRALLGKLPEEHHGNHQEHYIEVPSLEEGQLGRPRLPLAVLRHVRPARLQGRKQDCSKAQRPAYCTEQVGTGGDVRTKDRAAAHIGEGRSEAQYVHRERCHEGPQGEPRAPRFPLLL